MNEQDAIVAAAIIEFINDQEFFLRLVTFLQAGYRAGVKTGWKGNRDQFTQQSADEYSELLHGYFTSRGVSEAMASALSAMFIRGNQFGREVLRRGPGDFR